MRSVSRAIPAILLVSAALAAPASAHREPQPPPMLQVVSETDRTSGTLGSFCWRDGCVEAVDPRDRDTLVTRPGATVDVDVRVSAESVRARPRGETAGRKLRSPARGGRLWRLPVSAALWRSRDVVLDVDYGSGRSASFAIRFGR